MSCYIIYQYNIIDAERIEQLGPLSLPIVEKFGGELVVASGVDCLEGSTYDRMVAYKFAHTTQAKAFYQSEESQKLAQPRKEITQGIVFCVPEYQAATGSTTIEETQILGL